MKLFKQHNRSRRSDREPRLGAPESVSRVLAGDVEPHPRYLMIPDVPSARPVSEVTTVSSTASEDTLEAVADKVIAVDGVEYCAISERCGRILTLGIKAGLLLGVLFLPVWGFTVFVKNVNPSEYSKEVPDEIARMHLLLHYLTTTLGLLLVLGGLCRLHPLQLLQACSCTTGETESQAESQHPHQQ